MGKGGKSKNLALKGIEEEIDDSEDEDKSEDEDEDDDEDEDLTFIADEIIKLLQYRKNDKDKPPRKSKSSLSFLPVWFSWVTILCVLYISALFT